MKKLVLTKKEICTIPNYLTFLRIALVPVYMALLIVGVKKYEPDNVALVYSALAIMIFAALTDVFDGMIARKFNQGSYVGQLIDPIADKAMHIGAIAALAICGYLHWAFIIFITLREVAMIVVGSFIVNKVNIKANMLGKVASAIISTGVIASWFHPYFEQLWKVFTLDWIIVTIGLILNWTAAINYAVQSAKSIKADKAAADEKAENVGAEENAEEASAESGEEKVEE